MNWKNLVSGKISIGLTIAAFAIVLAIGFVMTGRGFRVSKVEAVVTPTQLYYSSMEAPTFGPAYWSEWETEWSQTANDKKCDQKSAVITDDTGQNPDYITTVGINTTGYNNLKLNFWYRIANALESGDYIKVQWSSNGTTWNDIHTFNNLSSGNWTYQSLSLPSGAENKSNLKIRFLANLHDDDVWKCGHTGYPPCDPGDEFRLDCVELTGVPVCTDADQDGYCSDVDCNDSNASINPGATEICNGIDDDCDGSTDEGFNVGQSCTVGIGQCQNSGVYVCTQDHLSTECNAQPGTPSEEVCDGQLDEDCDGTVDEDCECTIGDQRSCGPETNEGVCEFGVQTCGQDGTWGECLGAVYPSEEICDGLDNDCDGQVDEDDVCPSIYGVKYHDKNGNGQMDEEEESLAGWLIKLYQNQNLIAETTTTENGYTFSNLLPGDYKVCEINYDGWWVTDPWSGRLINPCVQVSFEDGDSEDEVVNFGNFNPVFIGGYKFNDLDQDGEKDENEEYLDGWVIRLYKLAIEHCDEESEEECQEGSEYWGMVGSHPTGSLYPETGKYGWSRNGPGTYFVCEVISDHQNWVETYPNEQTGVPNQSGMEDEAPYCHRVIVNESGKDYTDLNFGNYYPTSEQPEQPSQPTGGGGTINEYTLYVTKEGIGLVTSGPAGIDCGGVCQYNFGKNSNVTLTATPQAGSSFVRWEGDCSGTDLTCTLKMDATKSVKAVFTGAVLGEATTTEGEVLGETITTPTTVPTGFLGEAEIITPEMITFLATLWFVSRELKRRKKK